MQKIKILTAGDSSLLVEFGSEISPEVNQRITATVQLMKEQHIEGVVDLIPAFTSLLVNYDPRVISYEEIRRESAVWCVWRHRQRRKEEGSWRSRSVTEGSTGHLEAIAANAGLSPEEVIRIHSSQDYLIYMLGFLPGFAYLGGLDERIHTPRLANPRIKIRAGSVGIGGSQTGDLSAGFPGGWQLLGMTPVKTYDPGSGGADPLSGGRLYPLCAGGGSAGAIKKSKKRRNVEHIAVLFMKREKSVGDGNSRT